MNIAHEDTPLWYVLHTYSGYENKVAHNLEKMVENRGLSDLIKDIRVPTEIVSEVIPGSDETKEVERKLFPCYVLVKMVMNPETWHIVRNSLGVTGFVGPGSNPTPLSESEVEALGIDVKVVEVNYEVGDNVKICDGPLTGFIGIVEAISEDKTKVSVSASLFGRETKVELDTNQVEAVEQ